MLADLRFILFDAVGTLMYADPTVAEVYHAAGQPFGSRLSVAEIQRRFPLALAAEHGASAPTSDANERQRWRRIVRRVMDDVPEAGEAVFEQLWTHFAQPQSWRLFDDVRPALASLARGRFRLGIASNFDARLKTIVRGHPPLASCEFVFVSSEVGYMKPDPRFFRAIEERLGAAPTEIALVGDDEISDVQGATAAGWRAIRLDRVGRCSGAGPIRSLEELL